MDGREQESVLGAADVTVILVTILVLTGALALQMSGGGPGDDWWQQAIVSVRELVRFWA